MYIYINIRIYGILYTVYIIIYVYIKALSCSYGAEDDVRSASCPRSEVMKWHPFTSFDQAVMSSPPAVRAPRRLDCHQILASSAIWISSCPNKECKLATAKTLDVWYSAGRKPDALVTLALCVAAHFSLAEVQVPRVAWLCCAVITLGTRTIGGLSSKCSPSSLRIAFHGKKMTLGIVHPMGVDHGKLTKPGPPACWSMLSLGTLDWAAIIMKGRCHHQTMKHRNSTRVLTDQLSRPATQEQHRTTLKWNCFRNKINKRFRCFHWIVGCPKLADATSLASPKSSVLGSASCAYDAYVSFQFISSFQWIVNCANLGQEAHGPPPHKTLVIWTETMSSCPASWGAMLYRTQRSSTFVLILPICLSSCQAKVVLSSADNSLCLPQWECWHGMLLQSKPRTNSLAKLTKCSFPSKSPAIADLSACQRSCLSRFNDPKSI